MCVVFLNVFLSCGYKLVFTTNVRSMGFILCSAYYIVFYKVGIMGKHYNQSIFCLPTILEESSLKSLLE